MFYEANLICRVDFFVSAAEVLLFTGASEALCIVPALAKLFLYSPFLMDIQQLASILSPFIFIYEI